MLTFPYKRHFNLPCSHTVSVKRIAGLSRGILGKCEVLPHLGANFDKDNLEATRKGQINQLILSITFFYSALPPRTSEPPPFYLYNDPVRFVSLRDNDWLKVTHQAGWEFNIRKDSHLHVQQYTHYTPMTLPRYEVLNWAKALWTFITTTCFKWWHLFVCFSISCLAFAKAYMGWLV